MSQAEQAVRLSVALIVRNAAQSLRETLQTVHPIADEIIVLDTGSTDSTPEAAQECGAGLFPYRWQDDFSAARNECLSHVTGDWVLWLDAGEQLVADDAAGLRQFVSNEADPSQAYMLLVQVPPNGPHAAGEQVGRIRLIPRIPDIQFAGRVRETVADSLAEKRIQVRGLPYRIRRGEREHDGQAKIEKARRNIRLAQLEINERGPQPHLLNCLGDAFQTLHDNQRALQFYRHALDASGRGSLEMLEAYYGLVTSLDGDEAGRQTQLSLCVQALEVFPLDAHLLCSLGGYLQAQGRIELAARAYETAYRHGQINPGVWHVGEVREIAAICYSLTLQLQQKTEEAQEVLQEALASRGHSVRLRRHLMELHVKLGRRDEALAQAAALPEDTPNIEALRSAVRGACLAAQKNWIAAKAYLKTSHVAGCRDPLCLRWLSLTLLAVGEMEEARPILEQWHEAEPKNAEAAKYLEALQGKPARQSDEKRHVRIDGAQPPRALPAPPVGAGNVQQKNRLAT